MSLRKQFERTAQQPDVKKISVPDFGDVYIRALTAGEGNQLNQWIEAGNDPLCVLCCLGLADEDGRRLWANEDLDKIGTFSLRGLLACAREINAFNLMTLDSQLEHAKKN